MVAGEQVTTTVAAAAERREEMRGKERRKTYRVRSWRDRVGEEEGREGGARCDNGGKDVR